MPSEFVKFTVALGATLMLAGVKVLFFMSTAVVTTGVVPPPPPPPPPPPVPGLVESEPPHARRAARGKSMRTERMEKTPGAGVKTFTRASECRGDRSATDGPAGAC